MQNGKGSKPRPISDWGSYQSNWENINWKHNDYANILDGNPPEPLTTSEEWKKVSKHAYYQEEHELHPHFDDTSHENSGWTTDYQQWVNSIIHNDERNRKDFFTEEECNQYFKGFAVSPVILHESKALYSVLMYVEDKKDFIKKLDFKREAAILLAVVKDKESYIVRYFKI
jgi:hypothetical protein